MPIKKENQKRYPPDWKLRSRFVRKSRAKDCCEWCGAKNYEPHPITGSTVILTVAHVYDKRPEAAALNNLAALCQRCHLKHDRNDHVANRRKDLPRSQTSFEFKTTTKAQHVQEARAKKKKAKS